MLVQSSSSFVSSGDTSLAQTKDIWSFRLATWAPPLHNMYSKIYRVNKTNYMFIAIVASLLG